jgi:tricarballylate dehydrogenase
VAVRAIGTSNRFNNPGGTMVEARAADVLIIGNGLAGCCAAISAQDKGARVLMIDKAPPDVPHGNTAFSGGAFRRVSEDYTRSDFYNDLMNVSGNKADPELAHILVDNSAQAQLWLDGLGVRWTPGKRDGGRAAETENLGVGLARTIREIVRKRGIECRPRTEALSLLTESGRVVGARVRTEDGAETDLRAGATILASGGFSANPEMIIRYIGQAARHLVRRGSPYNTGDGLRMAEAIGAKLDWMDDFHGGLILYAHKEHREEGAARGMRHVQGYELGLLINQEGQRFVDEGENTSDKTYAKFGKIVPLTQPDGVAYVIFDRQTRDNVDPCYTGPGCEPFEAPTLTALAALIGVPADTMVQTVTAFNAGIRDGRNLSIMPPKSNFATRIDTPPFYAYKVTGGFTFTFGGLRTKPTGEVFDAGDRPIPGLFAAGEITTGLFYGNYGGGSSLPKCTIFGRMAGEAATRYAVSVTPS